MLKRHQIQVLRDAGHSQQDVAKRATVSVRSVRRVEAEVTVTSTDLPAERERRGIGRPSKAEPFRPVVAELLATEPDLLSVEILRRAKLQGYPGGKSALYDLIQELRPTTVRPVVRFDGLPGEFTQHDFGEVDVRFLDGTRKRIQFFASRLKYSRWAEVSIVPDQRAETLVRAWVDHFAAMEGVPLLAVFDRPKTVALAWGKDGQVTEWNPIFAGVASFHSLDLPYVFGVYDDPSEWIWRLSARAGGIAPRLTAPDKLVSQAVMKLWAEFARTGKPGKVGQANLGSWPAWTPAKDQYLYLEEDLQIRAGFSRLPSGR
jgi:transposase